jgi:pyruvate dehydrogenase E1 component alpha subunit
MPGFQVDGNDLFAVYQATTEAVERARAGDGPTLIEAVTYRVGPHTTADDPGRYRTLDESERWKRLDPLERVRLYLSERDHWDPEWQTEIDVSASEEIEIAVATAEGFEEPSAELMFDSMFADTPPILSEQRDGGAP